MQPEPAYYPAPAPPSTVPIHNPQHLLNSLPSDLHPDCPAALMLLAPFVPTVPISISYQQDTIAQHSAQPPLLTPAQLSSSRQLIPATSPAIPINTNPKSAPTAAITHPPQRPLLEPAPIIPKTSAISLITVPPPESFITTPTKTRPNVANFPQSPFLVQVPLQYHISPNNAFRTFVRSKPRKPKQNNAAPCTGGSAKRKLQILDLEDDLTDPSTPSHPKKICPTSHPPSLTTAPSPVSPTLMVTDSLQATTGMEDQSRPHP